MPPREALGVEVNFGAVKTPPKIGKFARGILKMSGGAAAAGGEQLLLSRLGAHITHPAVLAALAAVPRALFLEGALARRAHLDDALPIGHGQTTSQPTVIAEMMQMMCEAAPRPGAVLEIGAGCGYQTALLSHLGARVFAMERVGALARRARETLWRLGYRQARVVYGDGMLGLPEEAPFDGVIVAAQTAAAPEALCAQLSAKGRLVLPLMEDGGVTLAAADSRGRIVARGSRVRFVPLLDGTV